MDFGIDTLVYIIIVIIFVLAQATRKRKAVPGKPQAISPSKKGETLEEISAFWKVFLGNGLTANQASEPVRAHPVPLVFNEPEVVHRTEPALKEPVIPKSSFRDSGYQAETGLNEPVKPPDGDPQPVAFDLRSAVIYSVILERKYV
jgi:hypothetical protein